MSNDMCICLVAWNLTEYAVDIIMVMVFHQYTCISKPIELPTLSMHNLLVIHTDTESLKSELTGTSAW